MSDIFLNLALVLCMAAVGGVVARKLKQPPLLGYVAAGIGLAWLVGWPRPEIKQLTDFMGRLGVTLLLFLAGLELPLAELKKTGKTAVIVGLGQVIISSIIGFGLVRLLGFDTVDSLFLGMALTFGSTIMVVKLLSEKGDLQSLYGKITVGYLLVQDFVAVGLLVFLSENQTDFNWVEIIRVVVKGLIMIGLAVWLSGNLMGKVFDSIAKSTELVFVSAIGWCLMVAAVVGSPLFGFSLEIGGFLAGLALASIPEQAQIIARVKPLRDFFLIWFFVALGTNINWYHLHNFAALGIFMIFFVLIINPLVVMFLLGCLGYKSRVLFMSGLAIGQLSEFSLILVANAVRVGQIETELLSLVTIVGMITMTISTYLIMNSVHIYTRLKNYIKFFEKKQTRSMIDSEHQHLVGHVVLFGHNRIGSRIRPVLEKSGFDVVVVDFNPDVVEDLQKRGVKVVYGDMSDHELYPSLGLYQAGMIISTVPDVVDNLHLIQGLKTRQINTKIKQYLLLTANDYEDAQRLYRAGADYVLLPLTVGGDYLANILQQQVVGSKPGEKLKHLSDFLTSQRHD